MSLRQQIVNQFKQPSGFLGGFAGFVMAHRQSNIARNLWTLDLLDLQPDDRVLEIGFGPGIALAEASRRVTAGLIVGIDHSDVMLAQASKRVRSAITEERVELHVGTPENLPDYPQPFHKIYSANVVQFWQDPVAVFTSLRNKLVQGGVIATTFMPRHSKATTADAFKKAEDITAQLREAGFSSIRIEEKVLKPVSAISVLAVK